MRPTAATDTRTSRSRSNRRPVLACLVAVALLGFALTGCSGSSKNSGGASVSTDLGRASAGSAAIDGAQSAGGNPPGPAKAPANSAAVPLQQRDIVRTGTIAVQVADVDRAAADVISRTLRAGGRVDQDDRSAQAQSRRAELVVRLPPAALDAMIAAVSGLGTETSRTVQGQDVTASRADVNARVSALTTSVGRLRDFLKASGTVSDLVVLESQLSQRESELESTVAQQRALADQVALATLSVELTVTGKDAHHGGSAPSGFGSALSGGLHALAVVFRWSFAGVGYALPFLLVVLALVLPVAGWRRWRSRRAIANGLAANGLAAEARSAEARPAEARPAEARSAEAGPAGVRPAEARPAEGRPSPAQPGQAQRTESRPVDAAQTNTEQTNTEQTNAESAEPPPQPGTAN